MLGTTFLLGLLAATASATSADFGFGSTRQVAAAWYAGWHSEDFPLSKLSWSKYTHITYAFAMTTPDVNTLSLEDSDGTLLPEFVRSAKKHNVKALVSLGGWTGSRYFSSNVATEANRTAFVKTVLDFAEKYDLDGIDFDWEYPNSPGIGCNVISPNDTSNYLLFLQDLRATNAGKKLTLTAATSIFPFVSDAGSPSTSVEGFAKVFDYIAIMNYDVWGSWSSGVGPNAPLNDTCADGPNQQGSAVSAVAAWTKAGMPTSKIVLAVPGYGHSFRVNNTAAFVNGTIGTLASYPAFDKTNPTTGDIWDDAAGTDVCGNVAGPGGNFNFWGLISNGFLTKSGKPAKGISYRYDECSQTPYVYNPTSQVMVSFDNADSFAAKGKFIKSNGLRGFALWEAGGDYNDILLNSIRKAAGYH